MSFSSLGLQQQILQAITEAGYTTATAVQKQAIPKILKGQDVMAGAQTGTGKTAAFALPILQLLSPQLEPAGAELSASTNTDAEAEAVLPHYYANNIVSALVLTPTRELAQQVHKSFVKYGKHTQVRSVLAYGGASINVQIDDIKRGVDVLVATPGRLLELLQKRLVDLRQLKVLVFDEADRMLDMGFMVEIERILKVLPASRQTLLFSATFGADVFKLSKTLMKKPVLIEVDGRNKAATKIEQLVYTVDENRKRELVSYLIGSKNWHQVLIFTRTKQGADLLTKEMVKDGILAQSIHGDKSQGARDRALEDFRAGKVRALVATDVAARGLDIPNIEQVFNYELPYNAEDYIHRIGRTGRAGKAGLAITLVSAKEQYLLKDVEEVLGESLPQQWLPGFEPDLQQESFTPRKNKAGASKKRAREKALGTGKGASKNSRSARPAGKKPHRR